MPLRATYKGHYQGAILHSDSNGIPLCITYNYPSDQGTLWGWAEAKGDVTCRRCLKALAAKAKPIVEQTLRKNVRGF